MACAYKRGGSANRGGKYYIAYRDHTGRRRTECAETDVKETALAIARHKENLAAKIRAGLVDPRELDLAQHRRRPLQQHLDEYLAHCRHSQHNPRALQDKTGQLTKLVSSLNAGSLADITDPNAVDRHLQALKSSGLSACTVNHHRASIVAFVNWCVQRGRLPSNPLTIIAKLNEDEDRRHNRRALTENELQRLLDVAAAQDAKLSGRYAPRHAIYLTAALTGLRRSELGKLTWGDVDLDRRAIVVRVGKGKAKREDEIPLHTQVHELLLQLRPRRPRGDHRVFGTMPTIRTVYLDFERSGIPVRDESGRCVDLHALRTTLGTNLARCNVSPQKAQQIMRHADMRTTLKHYTDLRLHDAAAAMDTLPPADLQRHVQRAGCISSAETCEPVRSGDAIDAVIVATRNAESPRENAGLCGSVQDGAKERAKGFEPSTFSLGSCAPSAAKVPVIPTKTAAARVVKVPSAAPRAARVSGVMITTDVIDQLPPAMQEMLRALATPAASGTAEALAHVKQQMQGRRSQKKSG